LTPLPGIRQISSKNKNVQGDLFPHGELRPSPAAAPFASHVRQGRFGRPSSHVRSTPPARGARRRAHRDRGRGQGLGGDGAGGRAALRGQGPGRAHHRGDYHASRLRAADRFHPDRRSRASRTRCKFHRLGEAGGRPRQDGRAQRPGSVPAFGRSVGAVVGSGRGRVVRRQGGADEATVEVGRAHLGDELRAQAPVAHQGRAAGGGLVSGAASDARDLGRARRRS
jgi:hypothetical protein